MAQLKDSVITGSLRVTDSIFTDKVQFNVLNIPTASNGTTYGPGTSGQVLKSNGTSVYWAADNDTNKYHKTGSWNGLTYTATAVNSADALAFTIPTGTSATTVALGNHTHNYAASDSAGGAANTLKNFTTTTTTSVGLEITTNVVGYVRGLTQADWNYQQTDGSIYGQFYSDKWKSEIFQDYRTGQLSVRGKNNGTWQNWRRILDETNYTTFTVTKTGTGASGTWGISISGNAATATEGKYLMNRGGTTVTVGDSSWAIKTTPSGQTLCATVWKQRWSQSGLTYTPSGGSATTLSDTADLLFYLSSSNTSNSLQVNMQIDGLIYSLGGFVGNVTGNCSGSSGSCTGLAAKATGDASGNAIASTYLKLAGGTMTGRLTTAKTINQIITGSGTAASDKGEGVSPRYFPAKWTFNTGLTATNGDIITIKIPVAGHTYGVFMSINNGTNYYPVVLNGTDRLTTHYPVNTQIMVMFDSSGSAADMIALAGANARATVSGGVWRVLNYYDSNTKYSPATLGSGYGTCTTAEATVAKVVTLSSYALVTGGIVSIKFTYDVPANSTLNINSRGAKAIYYHGASIQANVIRGGDVATFIYSGQYHLIAIDSTSVTPFIRFENDITINAGTTATYKLPGIGKGNYQLISLYTLFNTSLPSGTSFSWSIDAANDTVTIQNKGTSNLTNIRPVFGSLTPIPATKQ